MKRDFAVRERNKGLIFHIDDMVMNFTDAHNHLLACGFSQIESAQYMRKLLEDGK